MKSLRAVGVIGVLGSLSTVAAFSVACSACSDEGAIVVAPEDGGTVPAQDASGPPPVVGGGNDAATDPDNFVPPGCSVNATPADDPCVIIEALGVFVSKKLGSALTNGGSGTLSAPFASLQKGIAEAKRLKKRVYACAETYDEAITFENGVSVFGYFNCDKPTWTVIAPPAASDSGVPSAGVRARIVSPTSPAARATGIANDTVIESVDMLAPDVTATPSASSVGLIAQNSSKLTLSHVTVHAGVAGKGQDGVAGVQIPDSPATRNGAPGFSPYWCHTPPGSVQCSIDPKCIDEQCVTDHSTRPGGTNACASPAGVPAGPGGNGGAGGNFVKEATSLCKFTYTDANLRHVGDGDAKPATATTALGGTGAPLCAQPLNNGTVGANGAAGTDGTSSAGGTVTAQGFVPGDGVGGTNGAPGQGGGGGGGAMPKNPSSSYYIDGEDYWGSSGSGGGAGGCAGLAGKAGKGGGASIGIILFDSPIVLRGCIVEASNGGAGGAGSLGSNPTPPGEAGPAYGTDSVGTVGGRGGEGGPSGWSGNGAGGPSIGMATHGAAATLVNTVDPTVGLAGAGTPAVSGNGKTIPAGAAAAAAAFQTF